MPNWTRNTYKNGIEIKFEDKPSAQIIERLKKDGWKWYPKKAIWYTTYSNENIISAKRICECEQYYKNSNHQNQSLRDFESKKSAELIAPLKKDYASIWETRFDNTPYYDIDNLKLHLKRKQQIKKINKFFLQNCGYTNDELQNMNSWDFCYFTKFGSNQELSFDILYDKMVSDALKIFKERYRLFFELQDSEYRQRLLTARTQRNKSKICIRCKINTVLDSNQLICDKCSGLYGLKDELKKLDINSGVFWKYLETFGRGLQPVDRIAARVSNGHSCINESCDFMEEALEKLTLNTIDPVTKAIRPLLTIELEEKIAKLKYEKTHFYLCAVYYYTLKDESTSKKYLIDFINHITPQKIILDYIEEKIKPRHASIKKMDNYLSSLLAKKGNL